MAKIQVRYHPQHFPPPPFQLGMMQASPLGRVLGRMVDKRPITEIHFQAERLRVALIVDKMTPEHVGNVSDISVQGDHEPCFPITALDIASEDSGCTPRGNPEEDCDRHGRQFRETKE